MTTLLIIFTIVIIIITATIFITVNLEYDILNNVGKIKVKLFKFLIVFSSGITISDSYLNFNKKKNKVIKIKIDLNDKKIQFFEDLNSYLKHKIFPININLNVLLCANNPFIGCLLSGLTNTLISILLLNMLKDKYDVLVNKNIQTGFRQNLVKFNLKFSFIISLYDYFWAYLKAYKAGVRREREKKLSKLQ